MTQSIFGFSPEFMEQAKRVGEYLSIEIRKHRKEGKVEIRYILTKPCPGIDLGMLADEFANQAAWGHASAFNMKGTIVDAN